jgi:Ala-tRNA(Pro) deacylase
MSVLDYLKKAKVKYEVTSHKPVYTAQRIAAVEHEPGRFVAKPVIVKADDKFVMCVLAACAKIDFARLKKGLKAKKVELASEDEIAKIFEDCDVGAEPPFGNLYELATVMDKALEKDEHILFQAGVHDKAVRMKMKDYIKLAAPEIIEFSCSGE